MGPFFIHIPTYACVALLWSYTVLEMHRRFDIPNPTAIVREQAATQADKCQTRLLSNYERDYMFLSDPSAHSSSAVADFLRDRSENHLADTYHLLRGIGSRASAPIRWVDAGGGRMLAQRDLMTRYDDTGLTLDTVDLFDHGQDDLTYEQHRAYEHHFRDRTPTLIQDDVTYVHLPGVAHLTTAFELVQYLDDPLTALANLYNQTAVDGIIVIGTGYDWSRSILRKTPEGEVLRGPSMMPAAELLRILRTHDIAFAATREPDLEPGRRPRLDDEAYQILAIEKRAHTSLHIAQSALAPKVMPDGYKVQYYPVDTPEGQLIDIVEL